MPRRRAHRFGIRQLVRVGAEKEDGEALDEIESIEAYKEGLLSLSEDDKLKFTAIRDNEALKLREAQIKAAGGGKAGALVQLITSEPVGKMLQSFFLSAR